MADHDRHPRPTSSLTPRHLTTYLDPSGRHYSDIDGVRWRVHEVQHANRPSALYFESETAFRRVIHYPENWKDLTAKELERLSHDW